MCSHVPEDERIEKFNDHVRNKALTLLREDLTVSEKFTVSMLDGLDVRETLSKWYTGDLYVKQIRPPAALSTPWSLFSTRTTTSFTRTGQRGSPNTSRNQRLLFSRPIRLKT